MQEGLRALDDEHGALAAEQHEAECLSAARREAIELTDAIASMPADGLSSDQAVLCPSCKQHWLLLSADGRSVLCAGPACGLRLNIATDYDDGRALERLKESLAGAYQDHHEQCGCRADLAFSVTRPDLGLGLGLESCFGGEGAEGGMGCGEEFLCASCNVCQFYQVVM